MALLTIDLLDPKDVEFGIGQLNRVASRQKAKKIASQEREKIHTLSDEELDAEIRGLLVREIRRLLNTKTGRTLIIPFARRGSPDPASIDEIAKIIACEPGSDRVRKAHSLIAGLGRWETPRKIKVFEPVGGRPQRYRMNPDVADVVNHILKESGDHTQNSA